MVFNSYIFIFLLLPLVVLGYFFINKFNTHFGKVFLIFCSFAFYLPAGINALLILCLSIVINYGLSKLLYRGGKYVLSLGIVFNILLLFGFKYSNFFIDNIEAIFKLDDITLNIVVPLGISFYTFQQIAYLIEVYDDGRTYELIDYVLYVLFFPKLIMGPITSPQAIIEQFNDVTKKKIIMDNLVSGIQMFAYGLFKKVLLADTFSKAVEWGFANLDVATSVDLIIVMLSYTFQIYFDFSGYSDMAIGISRMLNIELPMNFDSPYKALSIRDFWKRWHISLTQFLTRYVYIPLGGNRKGTIRTYINIIVVFLVSGIWHGANWTFVLWGFLHGIGNAFDRVIGDKVTKISSIVRWFVTFICINILWLLFRANSVGEWMEILQRIIVFDDFKFSDLLIEQFALVEVDFIFELLQCKSFTDTIIGIEMFLLIIIAFILCVFCQNNYRRKKNTIFSLVVVPIIMTWGIICLGSESTFVYFNF